MTVGERVKQLREMHGFTQIALASEVPGLKQSRLSRLESGLANVDHETLEILAIALDVRSDIFARPGGSSLSVQTPQLRARSRLSQTAKSSAVRWAQLIFDEQERLENGSVSPIQLERYTGRDPQEAARDVRVQLGFPGNSPLPYLVLAIERLGVAILGIPTAIVGLDAFCAWDGTRPVMAICSGSPGDRIRWSVAHELGHLVLHKDFPKSPQLEEEADQFAAELLTPLAGLSHDMPRNPQLSHLTVLKTRWGVSIKSLVRRARELGVVDQDRALSLYKQISSRGWNKKEPGFVPEEKPRGFRKLAELQYGEPILVEQMAAGCGWSDALTRRVLDRHAGRDELPFETSSTDDDRANVRDLAGARRNRTSSGSGSTSALSNSRMDNLRPISRIES